MLQPYWLLLHQLLPRFIWYALQLPPLPHRAHHLRRRRCLPSAARPRCLPPRAHNGAVHLPLTLTLRIPPRLLSRIPLEARDLARCTGLQHLHRRHHLRPRPRSHRRPHARLRQAPCDHRQHRRRVLTVDLLARCHPLDDMRCAAHGVGALPAVLLDCLDHESTAVSNLVAEATPSKLWLWSRL